MRGTQLGGSFEQQARRSVFAQAIEVVPAAQTLDATRIVIEQRVQPECIALVRQQ